MKFITTSPATDPGLLVYGFISDGATWKKAPLYGDLLQAGYKVIIPDMRGNGKSGKPHTHEAYETEVLGYLKSFMLRH